MVGRIIEHQPTGAEQALAVFDAVVAEQRALLQLRSILPGDIGLYKERSHKGRIKPN